MTAAADASALEPRVGHYYQVDDTYRVGREKVREYARAVQDYHPAHWMSPQLRSWAVRVWWRC
jgi:hypothetical protein